MEALKTVWTFFQNEILGMHWLSRLIGTILNACGLDTASPIGGSVQFFIYDTIKIMVLLGVVLAFMMGVTTLSLPSIILLRKAVKPKLLGIFIAICSVGIILVGYFFNFIQPLIL